MSCSPYDLRDYLFEELTPAQNGEVRFHLKACSTCSAELQELRSTRSALLAVRDEEMPQRIGFVSDKVFEPSLLRRWFTGFWTSAARIGFVSAAMLSAAIVVHALRPVQPVHNPAQPAVAQAEIDRRVSEAVARQVKAQVSAQIDSRVATAVAQAVSEAEDRAQQRTTALLAAAEKRRNQDLQAVRVEFQQDLDYLRSRSNLALVSQNLGGQE